MSSARNPRDEKHYATSGAERVFVSFRFAEAEAEAKALQAALAAKGVGAFVSGAQSAGDDLQERILGAFKKAEVVVIMGSKTYGAATGPLFSTRQEMNLTLEDVSAGTKKMYLFKMCDAWEEIPTRAALSSKKYKEWMAGKPIPAGAVDEIVSLLDPLTAKSASQPAVKNRPTSFGKIVAFGSGIVRAGSKKADSSKADSSKVDSGKVDSGKLDSAKPVSSKLGSWKLPSWKLPKTGS